ncbi:MAG TPA: fatty acid desaturase, partial [Roseiflexaceae bacterium]|nr:fatty acid desaturase [Roseiflexaceae bacterium]
MTNVGAAISHRTYAQELRRRLPARFFRPVPHRTLWIIPYAAAVAAGTWAIAGLSLPWYADGLIGILIGSAFASLGFLGHEILHGAVVGRGHLRDVLGGLCLLPHAIAPLLWRQWHNAGHHAHTQIHGQDPDAYSTLEDYHQRRALQILHRLVPVRSLRFFALLAVWLNVHAAIVLAHALPTMPPRQRLRVAVETVLPVAFWAGMALWLGWDAFTYFYVLPLLVSNFIVMSYIATNHLLNPLLEEDDPLQGSLTVSVPKLLDVIHSNFSHHTEHHVFPAMSAKYAPQVKRLLKELWPDRYHEMPLWRALGLLWRTPRLYL